ncbi:MAG: FlgD immunoglobulin-like domain containing protein [bacterium]
MFQNYPNPFNPKTTINFTLPVESRVELNIYNMLGIKVRTLLEEKRTAGNYSVHWNGRDDSGALVPSGIYMYELVTSDFTQRKKMLLLK